MWRARRPLASLAAVARPRVAPGPGVPAACLQRAPGPHAGRPHVARRPFTTDRLSGGGTKCPRSNGAGGTLASRMPHTAAGAQPHGGAAADTAGLGEAAVQASSASTPLPSSRQLLQLAAFSAVPFVGFGFADNLIMILAGDAIDSSLGVTLGLTTLAAAGLGNLISDVAGLGLGEVIENLAKRTGLSAPDLSAAQQDLPRTRAVKGVSGALGLSVGCLLGMCPLLLMGGRKHPLYFTAEEELLYQTHFQRYGVSPQQFYELLRHARWRSADAGAVIVDSGRALPKVLMLFQGKALVRRRPGGPPAARYYEGRHRGGVLKPGATGGCIIGGTALVDESIIGKAYPNQVVAAEATRWVEWDTAALRSAMEQDPAIEAAVLQTLYTDLLQGLRTHQRVQPRLSGSLDDRPGRPAAAVATSPGAGRPPDPGHGAVALADGPVAGGSEAVRSQQSEARAEARAQTPAHWAATTAADAAAGADAAARQQQRPWMGRRRGKQWPEEPRTGGASGSHPDVPESPGDGDPLERMYELLLRAVLSDDVVHPVERMLVTDYARAKGITSEMHDRCLARVGWTAHDWANGLRGGGRSAGDGVALASEDSAVSGAPSGPGTPGSDLAALGPGFGGGTNSPRSGAGSIRHTPSVVTSANHPEANSNESRTGAGGSRQISRGYSEWLRQRKDSLHVADDAAARRAAGGEGPAGDLADAASARVVFTPAGAAYTEIVRDRGSQQSGYAEIVRRGKEDLHRVVAVAEAEAAAAENAKVDRRRAVHDDLQNAGAAATPPGSPGTAGIAAGVPDDCGSLPPDQATAPADHDAGVSAAAPSSSAVGGGEGRQHRRAGIIFEIRRRMEHARGRVAAAESGEGGGGGGGTSGGALR